MRKRLFKRILPVFICACLLAGTAFGETERGDLSDRFSEIPRIEYNGASYSLRSRITTVLLMGVARDEALGRDVSDFTALVVLDDNAKRIMPVRLDGNLMVELEGAELPLREVYAQGEDQEENCLRMVDAVNALLGEALIDDYFAFEVEGASAVDGYVPVEGNTEEQLRALKAVLEEKSLDELSEQYAQLSDYIITDMKSGAVMKIADKSERYERLHSVPLPTLAEGAQDVSAEAQGNAYLRADAQAILPLLVDLFYEEDKW